MLILAKNNHILNYSIYYKEEKYLLGNKNENSKKDKRNLISKSLDNKNVKDILLKCIF